MASLILYSIPLGIYALVAKRRGALDRREIAARLGLSWGEKRYYAWALVFTFLGVALSWAVLRLVPESVMQEQAIATSRFAGKGLSLAGLFSMLVYGLLETALGEELFFRGLIAGWLGRRMSFWAANAAQAAVFTLPHLLMLLVEPRLWPLAIALPFVSGLMLGWLRLKAGSILPGWLVHGLSNVFSALMVSTW